MFNDRQAGQSLIEVIVAATVGIMVVGALTFATIFSLRNANFAKNSAQATKLAQEGIEKIRTLRDRDGLVIYTSGGVTVSKFSDLYNPALSFSCSLNINNCYFYFNVAGTLTGGTSANFDSNITPNFQRQFLIEDADPGQKKITALVKWSDFACGATPNCHESRLTTILRKL